MRQVTSKKMREKVLEDPEGYREAQKLKKVPDDFEDMTEEERRDLAALLRDALRRMSSLLDRPHYNYMIYQLPCDYHLNIRIQPVVSKIAGFEKGTGIYINPVPPEQAAAELRQA